MSVARSNSGTALISDAINGDFASYAFSVLDYEIYSLHLHVAGTLEGTISLEATNSPDKSSWFTVANTTATLSGVDGDFFWNVTNACYSYIRLNFEWASGAGTFTVWFAGRG